MLTKTWVNLSEKGMKLGYPRGGGSQNHQELTIRWIDFATGLQPNSQVGALRAFPFCGIHASNGRAKQSSQQDFGGYDKSRLS